VDARRAGGDRCAVERVDRLAVVDREGDLERSGVRRLD
jgi:hypothetical protein